MAELRTRLLQSAPSEYGFCSVGLICIWCLECLVMERANALFWVMRAGVSNQCFSVYPVSSVIWITSDCVAHLTEVLRASLRTLGFCMAPDPQIIEWYEGGNCSQTEILPLGCMRFNSRTDAFLNFNAYFCPCQLLSVVNGKSGERQEECGRLVLCLIISCWVLLGRWVNYSWCNKWGYYFN